MSDISSRGVDMLTSFVGDWELDLEKNTELLQEVLNGRVGYRRIAGKRIDRFEWNSGDRMLFAALSCILEYLLVVGSTAFCSILLAIGLDTLVGASGNMEYRAALV